MLIDFVCWVDLHKVFGDWCVCVCWSVVILSWGFACYVDFCVLCRGVSVVCGVYVYVGLCVLNCPIFFLF